MKQTNLSVFYHLGKSIAAIDGVEASMEIGPALLALFYSYAWLINFVEEMKTVDLPDSITAARSLMAAMDVLGDVRTMTSTRKDIPVTSNECYRIQSAKDWFEKCFDREYRYLDVFTVTAKGIYDTRLLMLRPEEKFSERIRRALPQQTLSDLREAARCLVFEIPTACAFHICRATEALMLAYFEVLSGHPWQLPKNRDWRAYIDHLVKEGAPKAITTRLDEIREMDRNAYAHPDRNITLEESPVQFELCTNVMFQMASEMDKKLNP